VQNATGGAIVSANVVDVAPGFGIEVTNTNGTYTVELDPDTMSIGYNQTWQNVASSRSANGTTYTNNTGRPITVAFTPGAGSSLNVTYRVGGLVIGSVYISQANAITFPFSFVVPVGSTYSITSDRGTTYWTELR
jgi:hypothetical protein